MSDFRAGVRDRSGTVVIDMEGDLDGRADTELTAAYARAEHLAPHTIVLGFADVGYINSTGIALIVGVLSQARAAGIALHAVGLTEHYRHIFEITRLADFMRFFASEDEAVGDDMTAPA
jgi:anti-anti-sigma factor